MDKLATVELSSGRSMPGIGLGTWLLTNDTAGSIANALSVGYKMIDTSGDYGTQAGIGTGVAKSGVRREDFYLVTKVEEDDDAYMSVRHNLSELQLDYADLVLIHRPPPRGYGRELWDGLRRAQAEGLTKDIGVSNYSITLLQQLIDETGDVPVVNQIEWTPFGYSREMLDFCENNGIVIQAYSPLTRAKRLNDETLTGIANKHGKTAAQVVLRWNIQLGVVPIVKANGYSHQKENLDIFDFELNDEQMDVISALNEGYSSLGSGLEYV